jgi:sortilin (neurotensin receptor 3)
MKIRALAAVWSVVLLILLGIATSTFAQPPGQWFSIGPRHVAAPGIPADPSHQPFGEYHNVGRLTTMAIHPTNPQIIYVGSPGELGHEGCGIWKTTDGGTTWTPVGDSLPTLAVAAIAIDPTHPDRVYVATSDHGIFRSDDAGQSWANISGPQKIRTNTTDGDRTALLINPLSPNVIYLTTDKGVLRSTDSGHTWPPSLNVGMATNLVMDPLNPDVLYAGILGQGVYKTVDGGAHLNNLSWQLLSQFPSPFSIAAVRGPLLAISHPPTDPHEAVYALYPRVAGTDTAWDLFRMMNGSPTWTGPLYSCTPPKEGCVFFVLGVDPRDPNRVFLGGPLLFISQIGVTTFTRVPDVENDRVPASGHGDYWDLVFDPIDPLVVYGASDGGVFRSSKRGETGSWAFIGAGITNAEMYSVAQAATFPGRLLAGTQDNGNIRYTGDPVWDHIPLDQVQGGDGGAVAIDPTDAQIFYKMGQFQDSLEQSTNGGDTFVPFASGLPTGRVCATFNSTFHFQVHPSVPTTLLASCGSLWRTTTNVAPGNWTSIFAPSGVGDVVRSAIDGASDVYYVGTSAGRVFAGPNEGSAWQQVLAHPNARSASDIEIDPAHPDTIYVSFAPPFGVDRPCAATAGESRIYRLNRLSPVPNPTFSSTDITGNLQASELCVNALAIDPHIPRTVYAATNRGVYRGRSNATGGPWVWTPYNNGLPLADVRDLAVHPITHVIDTATYGRSAFEVVPAAILPIAIDVKPGTSKNSIDSKSQGKIPVAILSSATFDAPNEVNRSSVRFGRTGGEASLAFCNTQAEDVNADGLLDQVCHFHTALTGFQPGDTVGVLRGLTVEGASIQGRDAVTIVK